MLKNALEMAQLQDQVARVRLPVIVGLVCFSLQCIAVGLIAKNI